ncbi:MAG TPA: ACT domain-containing protein [Anaerolineales bacterium]|nr:ACT domain-containing protein [Anaerolineales bacterium]HNN14288.1 ACT domain-containing protein [Anaerolineales bacterium]HNO32480.1 ACT domain-containing protein [Anaerolineales bacterium]
MSKNIVLTLTGKDKIGLVDHVTSVVVKRGGNVEASRMAHLGGEFAMLMLVTVADGQVADLDADFQGLRAEGYQAALIQTEDESKKFSGWLPYEIEVTGADHEGIIHEVSHHLASQGINIESMDTSSTPAPMSGTPLFMMKGVVLVPPKLNFHDWSDALEDIGDKLNVNVKVGVVK